MLVSVKITEAFQSITRPGIDPVAAKLLTDGKNDRFREEFGDRFVRGIKSGGQFFGVVQIFTRDETDSHNVSVGLSASYAAFGASGTFDQKFNDTVSSHRTKVTCYVEGGKDLDLPTSIDSMTQRAIKFPSELAGHAVPFLALLDDYGVLPLPDEPNFADIQKQKDTLVECARLRNLHEMWLNELDYISANPTEFVNPDNAQLAALRSDIDADLNLIAASASNALDHPQLAEFPVGLKVAVPPFPARIASAPDGDGDTHVLKAGPRSDSNMAKLEFDAPESYRATVVMTVSFPESSIHAGTAPTHESIARHAGIGIISTTGSPGLNALTKRVDADGQRVGVLTGSVEPPAYFTITGSVPYTSDQVHLIITVRSSLVERAEMSADGIQWTGVRTGNVITNQHRPPTKLILFAFSQDDNPISASFSKPTIEQI